MGIYRPKGMGLCHQSLIKLSQKNAQRVDKVKGKGTAASEGKRVCVFACVIKWRKDNHACVREELVHNHTCVRGWCVLLS